MNSSKYPTLAGLVFLAAAVGGGASSVNAAVIASCGNLDGHIYLFRHELDDNEPEWVQAGLNSTTIFLGTDKVEDVVIKGELIGNSWTRSASDYGAPVYEVFREGSIRQVVVFWGPVTEVYAFDTVTRTFSLTSQKSGIVRSTSAFVGTCE